MENNQTPQTDSTGSPEPEFVPIPDASDEDLKAFLETVRSVDSEPVEEEAAEPESQPVEQQDNETPEPSPEESAPVTEDSLKVEPEQQEAISRDEFERVKKQLDGQELLLKRRTSQIGEIVQQIRDLNKKLESGLEDKFQESPKEAFEIYGKIQKNQETIQNLEDQQKKLEQMHESQKIVLKHVKPGDVSNEDMAACLIRDGLDPGLVNKVIANPYENAHPETIIQLAKRAQAEATLRKVLQVAKQLYEENTKLKARPKEVLSKIEEVARRTPQLSAANGGAQKQSSRSANYDFTQMTDAEIGEFLKQARS